MLPIVPRKKSWSRRPRFAWPIAAGLTVAITVLAGLAAASYSLASTTDPTAVGPTPGPSPKVAAFLGDSYAAGDGADNPSDSFTAIAARELGWTYEPFAIGGTGYVEPSPDLTYGARVDAIIAANPDIVIVSGTRNDMQADPAAVRQAAFKVLTRLHAALPDATIAVIGPIWTSATIPDSITKLDQAVATAARAADVTFISAITNPWLNGSTQLLAPDGIHPSELGHQVLARHLVDSLRRTKIAPLGTESNA